MPTTQEIQQQIATAATQAGVPSALALAIAQQESSFDPNAVNSSNNNGTSDYGIFQINSSNLPALGLSPSSVMDPTTNINAGVSMLAQLQSQYGDDTPSIVAAYNAGPGAVNSGNIPASTQSYVASVLANLVNYGGATGGGADLYTGVSATGNADAGTSGDTSIDLSSIGLGVVTLTPEVIIGTGAVLVGLLWLMNKNR
jgi:soluble lytic murein transglycosylase-like protein